MRHGLHARAGTLAIAAVVGCTALPAHELDEVVFERHDIFLGTTKRQTVLTGFLLGGDRADVAVVHIEPDGARRLRIFAARDDTWAPELDTTLRPRVSFVDVADIGGRDRLISYEPGRLSWFDPESSTEHELLAVTTDFRPPPRGEVLHVDVTHDLNGDGRDDLVLPHRAGFRIAPQAADGSFAAPARVGADRTIHRVYGADGYRYDPWGSGLVHRMDHDRDGRTDLVYWNEEHFVVHHQDDQGRFAATPRTYPTGVTFDTDEMASLVAPGGGPGAMSGRVLHALTDMNGDGIGDLVIFALEDGGSELFYPTSELWNMRSALEVHFGSPTPGGTSFAPEPGAVLRVDGIPMGFERYDFDHDGQLDVMFTSMDPHLFKAVASVVSALLTQTVSFDLQIYRMADDAYADGPAAERSVAIDTDREPGETAMFPAMLVGDVNGDGRSDLLVQEGRERLAIHLGVPGDRLVARKPQQIDVAMPVDEELTWLVDLDRNGKQDVLIHNRSMNGGQRVTLLIAE